jgi:hypothetical protein
MLVNLKVTVTEQSAEGIEADAALRTDTREMANNAGHQDELAAMLDGVVKTIKVDLQKHTRDADFSAWYIVMVNRYRAKPDVTDGPDPRD